MRFKYLTIAAAAVAAAVLSPTPARAQASGATSGEEASALEEVVVSARRREESLQDVPISIVVRSGEYLQQAQTNGLTELARLVPGFVFEEFEAGGASTMGIRGLSTFSNQVAAQQSVGMLVDDVVLDTIGQAVTEFNDVERIEVLRGPQGTLFGRNTTGGVVHIVTRDPTEDFEANASMSYGSYDEVKWDGTINGALSDHIAARASLFTKNRDGYLENVYDGRKLGADQQFGLRTKFLYTPRENTRLKLSLTYVQREQESLSSFGGQPVVAFGPAVSETSSSYIVNKDIAGPKNDRINGIGYHPFEDEIGGASLAWEEDIGELRMTSITAYEYWDWEFGKDNRTFNAPVEPVAIVRPYAATTLDGWSQELRLASPSDRRMEYVVGAFATGSKYKDVIDFLINIGGDPDPAAAIYLFSQELTHRDVTSYAFFGESDFHLNDEVTLTAGARWTHDRVEVDVDAEPAPGLIPDFGIGIGPLGEIYVPFLNSEFPGSRGESISASEWSWRGGLRWEPTATQTLYGTVARGFKGPTISALGAFAIVRPETAQTYEIGLKSAFLGNRMRTSLTAFYTDVKNFQAEAQNNIETPQGTTISIVLTNAGKVRSKGFEFELMAAPVEALTFDFGVAYIDAKYVDYPGASCFESQTAAEGCLPSPTNPDLLTQDLSGRPLPFTPEWSASVAARYEFKVPFWSATHFLRTDYAYQSAINWSRGLAPLNEADANGVVGLSLGTRSADERIELVAYVKNLTNEFVVNGLTGGNEVIRAELQPEYQRTWGLRFNYRFR